MTAFNEYGPLTRVALRHARYAFQNAEKVARQWRALGYPAAPDFDLALAQYDVFVELLKDHGAAIEFLPGDDHLTLDSIYVRDATLVSPGGLITCAMGKRDRIEEPVTARAHFLAQNCSFAGSIGDGGLIEGGDLVWFDERSCAVAWGYRTSAEGIDQLARILGPDVDVQIVPLPHFKGPDDVFHLMSIISPLDADLALVFSPLMPVPFRTWLLEQGIELVEVPEDEFETMGCNVLATAPRRCIMLEGNPETCRRLEAAGCEVELYDGSEISLKGAGGPTCLTRPLERA